MTSAKAIAANRRNARRSTGPRTGAGKRKVAANALRHGVTANLPADPAMGAVVRRIASVLAGPGASPTRLALIMPIAEAEAELLRIRNARAAWINLEAAALPQNAEGASEAIGQSLTILARLDRYERRAMARRRRAMCDLRNLPIEQ
jgi:hypothetical protein